MSYGRFIVFLSPYLRIRVLDSVHSKPGQVLHTHRVILLVTEILLYIHHFTSHSCPAGDDHTVTLFIGYF